MDGAGQTQETTRRTALFDRAGQQRTPNSHDRVRGIVMSSTSAEAMLDAAHCESSTCDTTHAKTQMMHRNMEMFKTRGLQLPTR